MGARPWKFVRRCIQWRRIYMHQAMEWFKVFLSFLLKFKAAVKGFLGTPDPVQDCLAQPSSLGSHGMHDWHEAMPTGFLMPLEVAACRSHPDVCDFVQRLLADRWEDMENEKARLSSVPEDEMLESEDDNDTP